MNNLVKTWAKYAKNDIDVAIREMSRRANPRLRPYEIIVHHCHQCVEKMLKAYLIHNGENPGRIHYTDVLRSKCERFDSSFGNRRIIDYCLYLDTFWNIKYPDFTVSVNAEMTNRSINRSKRLYDFVSVRLGMGKVFHK